MCPSPCVEMPEIADWHVSKKEWTILNVEIFKQKNAKLQRSSEAASAVVTTHYKQNGFTA